MAIKVVEASAIAALPLSEPDAEAVLAACALRDGLEIELIDIGPAEALAGSPDVPPDQRLAWLMTTQKAIALG